MARVAVQAHVSVPGEQVPLARIQGARVGERRAVAVPESGARTQQPLPPVRLHEPPRGRSEGEPSRLVGRDAEGGRRRGFHGPAAARHVHFHDAPEHVRPVEHGRQAPMEMDRPGGRERDDREVGPMIPAQRERYAVEQDGDVPVGGPPEARLRFPARVRPDPHERHLAQRLLQGGNRRRRERIEAHLHGADAAGRREPLTREDPNLGQQEALRERIQRVGRDRIGDLRGGAARKRREPEREPAPDQGHRSKHFAFE